MRRGMSESPGRILLEAEMEEISRQFVLLLRWEVGDFAHYFNHTHGRNMPVHRHLGNGGVPSFGLISTG